MDDGDFFDYNEMIDDYINDNINQSSSDYDHDYEEQRYLEEFEENDGVQDETQKQQQHQQQQPANQGNVQTDEIVVPVSTTIQTNENNPTVDTNMTINTSTSLSTSTALRRRLEEIENRYYGGKKRNSNGNSLDRFKQQITWRDNDEQPNSNNNTTNQDGTFVKEWTKKSKKDSNTKGNELDENTMSLRQNLQLGATTMRASTRRVPDLVTYQPKSTIRDSVDDFRSIIHLKNASTSPIEGRSCIPITLADGTRIYIARKEQQEQNESMTIETNQSTASSSTSTSTSKVSSLLGVSMTMLLNRVKINSRRKEHERILRQVRNNTSDNDKIIEQQVEKDSQKLNETEYENDNDDVETVTTIEPKNTNTAIKNSRDLQLLWVDKHAPTSFSHLLSDERTNRDVVRALRGWDPYVFHRDAPPPPAYQQRYDNNNNNNSHNTTVNDDATKKSNSNDRRPDESSRVILLSGPPGVGKTTLAHVIVKHCGYRPIEINGSDERSESTLLDRVIRAMESNTIDSVLRSRTKNDNQIGNSDSRPNCLILDEIDGVDAKTTIQALVNIIRADLPSTSASSDTTNNKKGAKGRKASKVQCLRRPIIFICNNKYVPALKPLLPYCKYQFTVYPPSPQRLVSRLRTVLSEERLSIDNGGSETLLLNQLVSASCGDIRSCLYTLQFAASSASSSNSSRSSPMAKDISKALINALQGNGLKDERHDVSGIIVSIFRKEKKVTQYDTSLATSNKRTLRDQTTSSDNVFDMVRSYGEYSRILDCLFLNVMNVSYIDPTLDRCSTIHEWMSYADVCRSNKSNAVDFAIEALQLSITAAATHLLCRVEHQRQQKLTFTTQLMNEIKYKQESNKLIVHKFVDGISQQSSIGRHIPTITTEIVPLLLWILSAGNGTNSLSRSATSLELLQPDERISFNTHVSIVHSLSLSYVIDHDIDNDDATARAGQSSSMNIGWQNNAITMRIEPPIDQLIRFPHFVLNSLVKRREIPTAMKELLVRQVGHERLRIMNIARDEDEAIRVNPTKRRIQLNDNEKTNSEAGYVNDSTTHVESTTPSDHDTSLVNTNATNVADEPKKDNDCNSITNTKTGDWTTMKTTSANFLQIGAKRAKIARSERSAARVRNSAADVAATAANLLLSNSSSSCNKSNSNSKINATSKQSSTSSKIGAKTTSTTTTTSAVQMSHSGSNVPIKNVIRYKFVKGFTQAVRTPCPIEELL